MSITKLSQQALIILKRQTVFVLFLCYVPHIASEPSWLFFAFLAAVAFRLIADYYSWRPVSPWLLFILIIVSTFSLYGGAFTTEYFVRCLLIFIILKCLELNTERDLKVIVLCNFLLMFSALIMIQELWIIAYVLLALLANLSIMLKMSAPEATLRQISSRSGLQLLLAIPLSILLFFVFPRIAPLWNAPTITKGTTGFSERMSSGSVAEVFNDNTTAMQITFNKTPILKGYWRGIVLSIYTGDSWNPSWYNDYSFHVLPELNDNEVSDYDIILEPDQKKWLFYNDYVIAGGPNITFSPNHGLIRQNKYPVTERFAYSLKVQATPYRDLTDAEYNLGTQLPNHINPRLNAWAKEQFAKVHSDVKVFISLLDDYIHEQPFWYTLTPQPTSPNDKNQMDEFWFDTQRGFCEHYTSAVAYILRAVGIPARVILGYHGGQWNPISNTLTIQHSDAHAWLEYWQEGIGWQELDPTAFIAAERIDPAIQSRETDLNQQNSTSISGLSWVLKSKFILESMQYFAERWLLFYNQNSQQNLLHPLGLERDQLLQASVGLMILFFILIEFYYQWRERRALDSLTLEYHMLQKEFRRFNIAISPSATLKQQCASLINRTPALAPVLSSFMDSYEQLRLMQSKSDSKESKKEAIALFRTLRRTLRQRKKDFI